MTEGLKNDPPGGPELHHVPPKPADPPDLTWRGVLFNWALVVVGGAVIALAANLLPDMILVSP